MSNQPERTFSGDFKRFFVRGLAVLLPSVLTLWILVQAYRFVNNNIAEPVNQGVRMLLVQLTPRVQLLQRQFEPRDEAVDQAVAERTRIDGKVPDREMVRLELRRTNVHNWWISWWGMNLIGLAIAILGVYIAGRVVGGLIGPHLWRRIEGLFVRLPVIKQVYPSVKQVVDFFFSAERPVKFSSVVLVEYPSPNIWSIGFLTGPALPSVADHAGECVTVFVPSSPAPFTGWTITVPRSKVIDVQMSVDDAIRFLVSAGVLVPHGNGSGSVAEADATPALEAASHGTEAQPRGIRSTASAGAVPPRKPATPG
jgi:uncharacterized membrane protein